MEKQSVTVQAAIAAPIEKVWKCWSDPEHIKGWNHASDEWHTPHAENDLRVGGSFIYRMEAKDGSMGFDFYGVYDKVIYHKHISYTLGDHRKVCIDFSSADDTTQVIETFEAEDTNPIELQRAGWQAILNNFKKYSEAD